MRNNRHSLGAAGTAAAVAALALFVVFGNTNIAIMVAAAAALAGMYLLRRYARDRLVYDNDSQPRDEVSVPSSGPTNEMVDEGTIADLAERMRGRF